ncbi:hypothetical protein DSO57_1037325 [Entomophthora muscae]|uniref:Uncharacterized protein n=1 Tax=Entomophthora muscae TaxID=34485 RepID=A0ACC2U9T1_9FUNG|nr:hypothetical protein DSO57_1037325 [Entomophthora muscae]
MKLVVKSIDIADQLASVGQKQAAFKTYIAALAATANILSLSDFNINPLDRAAKDSIYSMFDTCTHCLDKARELCHPASPPPPIPPKALSRSRSHFASSRSPRQASLTSSAEATHNPKLAAASQPLPLLHLPEHYEGSSELAPLRLELEEICKRLDSSFTPSEKKPKGSRRARARSLVSSIRAKFDTTLSAESDSLSPAGSPSSHMSLKTMFSSPLLKAESPSSSWDNLRSNTESTKFSTPSSSDDEDEHGLTGIDAVLGGLPISNVSNPDDLVLAQTSPEYPSTNIPRIPRSPLVATLVKANGQLEGAKRDLVEFSKKATKPKDKDWPALRRLQHTIASASATMEKVSRLTRVDAANPSFSMFPPSLVAYQLTRIESTLFHNIPPEALTTHSHRTPHPRVVASTDFFNYLTRIIEMSILNSGESEERALTIKFWIKVASSLESLCNFQTLQAVVSALATPPIQRLKRTWRLLSKRTIAALQASKRLMSEEDNYAQYRRHLATLGVETKVEMPITSSRQPIIPYIGVFIMDMTYLVALAKRQMANPPPESEQNHIARLLEAFQAYLSAPKHSASPPAHFLKFHSKSSSMASFNLPFMRSSFELGPVKDMNFMSFLGDDSYSSRTEDLSEFWNKSHKDPDLIHNLQVVITHFILSQQWAPEKAVDSKSQALEAKPSREALSSPSSTEHSSMMLSPFWSPSSAISSKSSSESSLGGVPPPLSECESLTLDSQPSPTPKDTKPPNSA